MDRNRQAHDHIARFYDDRWHGYVEATVGRAVASMELAGDERVLDLAAGTGEFVRRLRQEHPDISIIGADLSFEMLRQAAGKSPLHRQWLQTSATDLPFADGVFDRVACINSFHCFRRPGRALREMRRVLQPGGQLLLLDWCDDYLTCKLCSLWLRLTDDAFHQTYTSRACRQRLTDAGFTIQHQDRFRVGRLWGMMQFLAA